MQQGVVSKEGTCRRRGRGELSQSPSLKADLGAGQSCSTQVKGLLCFLVCMLLLLLLLLLLLHQQACAHKLDSAAMTCACQDRFSAFPCLTSYGYLCTAAPPQPPDAESVVS